MLPAGWKPYLWLAWPLFFVFVVAGIALAIWQNRIEQRSATLPQSDTPPEWAPQSARIRRKEEWGEAPDVSVFYGRKAELAELEQWIVHDQCRLVGVLGMGGTG